MDAQASSSGRIPLLKQLLSLPPDGYVTYLRDDARHLLIQKFHLVITYIGETEWQIYMPSCIRNIFREVPTEALMASTPKKDEEKKKASDKDTNLVEVLSLYPKLSQLAFFITLELVNINLGNNFTYEFLPPYIDDLLCLEEAMMKGAKRKTLERYADLLMMDMRILYASIEDLVDVLKDKDTSSLSDTQFDNALHCGTMVNTMYHILLRFKNIPSDDLAKIVMTAKKKDGLLHIEKLEKMAEEIADEILRDLMRFTMGIK